MRTREVIKAEAITNFRTAGPDYSHGMAQLQVLLDIRELLTRQYGTFEENNPKD